MVIIKPISKGKGDVRLMDSKRGLFLTNILSKVIEKLFKNRNKAKIESNITPFQCGGVRNRGINDNLLIVNSAIGEFRKNKENVYLLFADLEKCFDKLWLKDCIKDVIEAGMPDEEAMYIYKMNKNVKVTVDTPVGKTEMFKVEEVVRQGTITGPQLCSVTTDKINKLEKAPELEICGVGIQYPLFVDDAIGIGSKKTIEIWQGR